MKIWGRPLMKGPLVLLGSPLSTFFGELRRRLRSERRRGEGASYEPLKEKKGARNNKCTSFGCANVDKVRP